MSIPAGTASRLAQRALIVGHHGTLEMTLRRVLEATGFRAQLCDTAADAEAICARRAPDLLVLLSDLPAFTPVFLAGLRQYSRVPALVVCDTASESPRSLLDAGADDVVSFDTPVEDLMARLSALLRRSRGTFTGGMRTLGDGIMLDVDGQKLHVGERRLALSPREFRFVLALAQDPGRTVSHTDLANLVWGTTYRQDEAIRALVKRLRARLDGAHGLIHAQHGVGYYLDLAACTAVTA